MKTLSFLPAPAARWLPASLLLLFARMAQANTYTVTTLADSGAGSLRAAITAANSNLGNDTINASGVAGTIQLASVLPDLSTNITLNGPGPGLLTVRGEGADDPYRIFKITNGTGTGPTVSISGLTITNGRTSGTGYLDGYGGGLLNDHGTLTLNNCTVSDHRAAVNGGAIFSNGFPDGSASLTLLASTVSGNTATVGYGGGIASSLGGMTVRNCTINGNSAGTRGGGIGTTGALTVQICTFNGNGANKGGGIYNEAAVLTVKNCTFSYNGSDNGGQHIYSTSGSGGSASVTLRNTILGPTAGSFPNLINNTAAGAAIIHSEGYNLSSDNGGGFLAGPGDQINADPLLDPTGLQNNGGPTQTIALLSGSPAIDQGNDTGGTGQDQRGQARPFNDQAIANAAGGDGSDIGALEAADPVQSGTALVVNTTADHDDGITGIIDCTLREAIRRTNGLINAQTIRFAPGLTGTITLNSALGPLEVADDLTLTGPGARILAVSGGDVMSILSFTPGSDISTVSGLTLRNGRAAQGTSASGAALSNEGALTVTDCAFVSNTATGLAGTQPGQAGGPAQGGAVFNGGTLTLRRCSFSGNLARGGSSLGSSAQFVIGPAGGAGLGGAVFNDTGALLTGDNCTFYNNSGTGGTGANNTGTGSVDGRGGSGFASVFNQGIMNMTSCTLSLNTGAGGAGGGTASAGTAGGALATSGGTSNVGNTISAANTGGSGPDVSGPFTSQGWNLIGKSDGSTGFTAPGDQTGTSAAPLDAKLDSFQDNGGPTNSMNLLADSPATDMGKALGLTTDQRGQQRPYDVPSLPNAPGGDGTDIGAVEADPVQTPPLFIVTTLDDHNDGVPSFRDCTLREAITAANASAGADTIQFQPGVSGLSQLNGGEILLQSALTLEGPGATLLTVDGGLASRIFRINTVGMEVTMADLTLQRGRVTGNSTDAGGAFANKGILTLRRCVIRDNQAAGISGGGESKGGGLYNLGTLLADSCTFSGNSATGGHNGFIGDPGQGGALYNTIGTVTLTNCTFRGNTAAGGSNSTANSNSGGAAAGAGLYTSGTLSATNCTFSSNTALGAAGGPHFTGLDTGGSGGTSEGGALRNSGTLTLTACTFSLNSATGGAGGGGLPAGATGLARGGAVFLDAAGSATVRNTLLAGNSAPGSGPDVFGPFSSGGFNLMGKRDGSTFFTATGDQTGTIAAPLDAKLGPLQNNGGLTDTMALFATSPALDKGHSFSLTTDQRGLLRLFNDPAIPNATGGDGTDTGALELQPVAVPPKIISITREGATMRILLQGESSRTYQLQSSASLSAPFTGLGAPQTTNSAGQTEFIAPGPLTTRRFYRAALIP